MESPIPSYSYSECGYFFRINKYYNFVKGIVVLLYKDTPKYLQFFQLLTLISRMNTNHRNAVG